MAKITCHFCGLERDSNKKPCWGCGEFNEAWSAAFLRHLPWLTVLTRSTRRFLRAAT